MRVLAVVCAAAILAPGAAVAEQSTLTGVAPATEVVAGDPQDTYGTASLTAFIMPSTVFTPNVSATTYSKISGLERYLSSGGVLEGSPMLPNGAQIERLELRACDTSATSEVSLGFGPCAVNGAPCTPAGGVATGVTATPGCNNFSTTLASPVIVNNQTTPLVVVIDTGTTFETTFSAVKLYYRLRVSPAPAVATFPGDVPTSHPFFRFVEALAAAGITGGCGAGAYCPDSAVTRGQMAVFLATALGLHFPN